MARLKGPILFTGSIGNVRSYYDKKRKRYIIATKGGASKEDIMNSPAFARTRENMNEFSVCGICASQIRKSLLPVSHLFYGNYFCEITKRVKEIQLHDEEHPRGFRSIELSKSSELLTTLNFNTKHSFENVLSGHPRASLSEDKKTVTLTLTNFKSYSHLHWPRKYGSYRFALVIAQIPDFEWNEEEVSYRPVVAEMEQLSVCTYTEWLSWNPDPKDIILEASFTQPALQQPGTTLIVAMGIEFTSAILKPTDSYKSPMGAIKIVECFV
jgi:hypothetical protein